MVLFYDISFFRFFNICLESTLLFIITKTSTFINNQSWALNFLISYSTQNCGLLRLAHDGTCSKQNVETRFKCAKEEDSVDFNLSSLFEPLRGHFNETYNLAIQINNKKIPHLEASLFRDWSLNILDLSSNQIEDVSTQTCKKR